MEILLNTPKLASCLFQVLSFSDGLYVIELSEPSEMDSDPGVEGLGHYSFGRQIGEGQCGYVRLGVHRITGIEVAIKTLSKAKFKEIDLPWPGREFGLMKYLDHPNIIQLYDHVTSGDTHFLVLELVQNGELLNYCFDHGPLDVDESMSFFRDIVCAIDYLHRVGIVHRDLKLENCLITSDNRIKVADFGLGHWYAEIGPLQTSCGSRDYAAPELFTARKYHGPPVDVWAMGVILYSMLTAEFPFEDVQGICNADWVLVPTFNVPESIKTILEGIFTVNPDLRLTVNQLRYAECLKLAGRQLHSDWRPIR